MRPTKWILLSTLFVITPSTAFASDARSQAMGKTGIATSNHISAALHNPSLASQHGLHNRFGAILPNVGFDIYDHDGMSSLAKNTENLYNEIIHGLPPISTLEQLNSNLDDLNSATPVNSKIEASAVISIPNHFLPVSLYYKKSVDIIGSANIASSPNPIVRYDNSTVTLSSFTKSEFGLSLSSMYGMAHQNAILYGANLKHQNLSTHSNTTSLSDFDLSDYDANEVNENAFNMDLGLSYIQGNMTLAVTGKNIIEKEVAVLRSNETYTLSPLYSVGAAYNSPKYAVTAEMDLTEHKGFSYQKDNTKFAKFGVEYAIYNRAHLRTGVVHDLKNNRDTSYTLGIGFKPFKATMFDISTEYSGDNKYGANLTLSIAH